MEGYEEFGNPILSAVIEDSHANPPLEIFALSDRTSSVNGK